MKRDELLALAERVEAATGADRDIDHAIYAAFNPDKPIPYDRRLLPWEHLYTASLDAAMSLVPSGLSWTLGQNVHHKHWLASVNYLDTEGAPACAGEGFSAAAPALALTAAALRAFAQETHE